MTLRQIKACVSLNAVHKIFALVIVTDCSIKLTVTIVRDIPFLVIWLISLSSNHSYRIYMVVYLYCVSLDMAKWAGWVGSIGLRVKNGSFEVGQNWVIWIKLKMGLNQSGYRLGWVDPIFHMIFFLNINKTICIFHLEIHTTNYLI